VETRACTLNPAYREMCAALTIPPKVFIYPQKLTAGGVGREMSSLLLDYSKA